MIKSNAQFKWGQELLGSVGILIIGMMIEWTGLFNPVGQLFLDVTNPATTLMVGVTWKIISPLHNLSFSYQSAKHIQQLEQNYSLALAKIEELEVVERENQLLREILHAADRPSEMVIATPVNSFGQPSIAAGGQQHLQPGQAVLAAGSLVGLIDQVQANQATVKLLPQLQQQAILVKTQSGATGLVKGNGKQILLTEVSPDVELVIGEKITTVGQELIDPDLLVGQVQYIQTQPTAPTQTAVLAQFVEFFDVPIVEVLP